jgi:hypothetical protein
VELVDVLEMTFEVLLLVVEVTALLVRVKAVLVELDEVAVESFEVLVGVAAVLVDIVVTPGQPDGKFAAPPLAYRLNCIGPPHMAVPVEAAPILPLQISVHALAPVRLEIADPWKLKVLPP